MGLQVEGEKDEQRGILGLSSELGVWDFFVWVSGVQDEERGTSKSTFSPLDFIEKLQNITLTEEEEEVIHVSVTHRDRVLEECSLSLLGTFLTTRSYNQRATKSLIRSVWKMGTDLRIIDGGEGLFQFKFSMESQLKWVLANGPWSFENHPLVLRRWERGMTASSVSFDFMPMWV
ncbi:hypothetical protein SO802_009352 [Lithocarpus litseifolius]|uniref:DUF4283 domain-containing protein n=1 Tax=Lithocarpus litseifolius TaxID=425828 RepID=A0AAW2DF04_9ROSI